MLSQKNNNKNSTFMDKCDLADVNCKDMQSTLLVIERIKLFKKYNLI